MKTKFDKKPICEVCGKEPATSFSSLDSEGAFTDWRFCGDCTRQKEGYYILIDDFFSSPGSTIDWLAHMHEKQMDWQSFMGMMHRFRDGTASFFKL